MNKALGLIVVLFVATVGSWAFLELQGPVLSPVAQAQGVEAPVSPAGQNTSVALATKTISRTQAIQSALQGKNIAIANVPFFSQFTDIQSPQWQDVGCGITSLAMMIDFYKPNAVSVNTLLQQGVAAGAYDQNAGWIMSGLIQLSERYGLTGSYQDLSKLSPKMALNQFETFLQNGPLILSVHNGFNPQSTVPHLVVIDGMKNNMVYYNDPAAKSGEKKISLANFLKGWKKKLIVLRPAQENGGALSLK